MIRETGSAALATMADNASVELNGPTLLQKFRILKSEGFIRIAGLTTAEGNGIEIWMINNVLSTAEALEAINLSGPLGPGQRVPDEQARRFVRPIGVVVTGGSTPVTAVRYLRNPKGGYLLEFSVRWTFTEDAGWGWLAVNRTGSALTTGATLETSLTHYGVWVK